MDRKIFLTEDGSHSLKVPGLDETYHSKHGAIQESQHVFIKAGLESFNSQDIIVFEMGFGTGLNAFLSYIYCRQNNIALRYFTLEKYPLSIEESRCLNYPEQLGEKRIVFEKLHSDQWQKEILISKNFSLSKMKGDMLDTVLSLEVDIVYYDAFGPNIQPGLWTEAIFRKMYNILSNRGLLVTYSAKGQVRRNLQSVGFTVERLPGPPGKREMLRATKT